MKFFRTSILTMAILIASSCTLDLLQDPNNVKAADVRPTLILNSMQRSVAGLFNTNSQFGMQLTRQINSAGTIYYNVFSPLTFNGTWSTAYAGILQDAKDVIEYSETNGWARHAGMARIIQAYTLVQLVDMFGDVPYSDAFGGLENLNPTLDDQAALYDDIIDMLNQAKRDLLTATIANGGYLNPLAETPTDLYYGNTYSRWVKLANSIKLKLFLNHRLVKPVNAADSINKILSDIATSAVGSGLITTQTDNWVFRYGTNLSDPDARHPRFVSNYPAGGGDYMSNHIMWQMYHGYNAVHTLASGASTGDPRIRFYFYRQRNTNDTDPNNIRCVTATTIPGHYPGKAGASVSYGIAGVPPGISVDPNNAAWSSATGTLSRTFCFPTNVGYWGRDHVNPEGIPPDNLLRTAYGVYPAGGRYDGSSQQSVNATTRGGMFGAGIQPMMMRSFVQFMLAEAANYLTINASGALTARAYFQNGMNYSFVDVRDWAEKGTYGVGTAAATEAAAGSNGSTGITAHYPPANYTTDTQNYVNAALAAYDAAVVAAVPSAQDAAMNYIAREYWVALFGNGVESYNLYRRTHMPTGFQPTINNAPGAFPRSFFYPQNFATLNSNVTQKADLKTPIFWDNTTATDIDF